MSSVQPGFAPQLQAWWLALRPRTLPASVAPLILGNALAWSDGLFSWLYLTISLLCAILLQIGVNLANDYFDFVHGVDTDDRLGPVRVTQSGLLSPETVRRAMWLMILAASALGLLLVFKGGAVIFWLGIASLLALLGYSGGPWPFASHALGEVVVFVFFGLVAVGGSYYVQTGYFSMASVLLGAATGCLAAAILLVNNIRDIPTDQRAGKNTLAVRLGVAGSLRVYTFLMALPFGLTVAGVVSGVLPVPVLLVLVLVIHGWKLCRALARASGRQYNALLAKTARFTFLFCVLAAAGVCWR